MTARPARSARNSEAGPKALTDLLTLGPAAPAPKPRKPRNVKNTATQPVEVDNSSPASTEPEVADETAAAAATVADAKDEAMATEIIDAEVQVDRAAAKAAKVLAACEADYRVIAVKEHAKANYNEGGWDIVLETMDAVAIYWVVFKARSSKGAIARMAEHVAPAAARRDEIVNA